MEYRRCSHSSAGGFLSVQLSYKPSESFWPWQQKFRCQILYALCVAACGERGDRIGNILPFPTGNFGKTLIKALADIILFLISYQIQREWVFQEA